MRLSLALGRTLAELGATMTADEFALWRAYDRIEGVPWPWLQTGTEAAASVAPWQKKGGKPARPLDFMPTVHPPKPRRQTPGEIRAAMALVAPIVKGNT